MTLVKKSEPNGNCFIFGHLPLCGCGTPDEVLALIVKILQAARDGTNVLQAAGGYEPLHYLAVYALDKARMLEHGGSCGWSWLTNKGAVTLAYLEKYGIDSDNDTTKWPWDAKVEWEEHE
jgi:hypothetical protein